MKVGAKADPDGLTLLNNYGTATTLVELIGGGIFDLFSIDLADGHNLGTTGDRFLSWTQSGGGTGSTSVTLDNAVGLQTFALNLTSFSLLPGSSVPWVQMDNFVVETLGPVPVPASLPLLGAGLAGLSALRWRKKA